MSAGRKRRSGPLTFDLWKALWVDWPALASAIGLPMIWIIHVLFPILKPEAQTVPIAMPLGASAIVAGVLLWRLARIERLFRYGQRARGVVIALSITRDRGRLEFSFEHAGRTRYAWTPVHKTRTVLALVPGTEIDVLFDPARPRRAIVEALYV